MSTKSTKDRRLDQAAQAVADLYGENPEASTGCWAVVFDFRTEGGCWHAACFYLAPWRACVPTPSTPETLDAELLLLDLAAKQLLAAGEEFRVDWLDRERIDDYLEVLDIEFDLPTTSAECLLSDSGDPLMVPMLVVGDNLLWSMARVRPMSRGGAA